MNLTQQEIINMMALTRIHRLSLMNARLLVDSIGNATEVLQNRNHLQDLIPEANEHLSAAFMGVDEALKHAEAEFAFAQQKHIRCLCITDEDYPDLLRQCPDAPLVLYYLGNADLNRLHIINVVGTRRCTEYGKDICRHFIADLQTVCPDVLIVSGLAYGIDVHAHRAALDCGLPTVGVLAHGLDMIYPQLHRKTAINMIKQGGLLTEYMSQTAIDKGNFVRRNRIVAGMTMATIVVESARKGGALITADLAAEYNREVCAFPGRVSDEYSEGCNLLIANQKAHLITNVDDFMAVMGWTNPRTPKKKQDLRQQELFPTLSEEEQKVLSTLDGVDQKPVNQIVIDANIPFSRVSAILFELELKGLVKVLGGARYKRLR